MKWTGNVAHMAEIRNAFKIWAAKPEEKRSLGRLSHGWEAEAINCTHEIS
jgi:hypothetical protein